MRIKRGEKGGGRGKEKSKYADWKRQRRRVEGGEKNRN